MIKKFNEFINESQTVRTDSTVYGENLFESITKSLIDSVDESINEGRITIQDNILNEGFFTNLFKSAANKAGTNAVAAGMEKEYFKNLTQDVTSGGDLIKLGASIKKEEIKEDVWKLINTLCNDAVELIEKINKKEEEIQSSITKKLSATKEAIAEFVKKSQEVFVKITETSKNAIGDAISALRVLLGKLAEISVNALKATGKGAIIAVCLPFVLVYSTYKSVSKLCKKLAEKAKIAWNDIKDSIQAYGKVVSEWFKNQLNTIKETLKQWADKANEQGEKMIQAVAKAYLYVVGICGLIVDKTAETASDIKDAFNSFIDSAKDYSIRVKDYISDRWDKVSTWTKEKSGEFADGVKNVWNVFKDKVNQVVKSTKDAVERLKEYKDEKIDQIETWSDDKKKAFGKSILAWAVDKWGADEVKGWIN